MKRRKSTSTRRIKRTHRRSWLEQKVRKAQRAGITVLAGIGAVALTIALFGLIKFFGG